MGSDHFAFADWIGDRFDSGSERSNSIFDQHLDCDSKHSIYAVCVERGVLRSTLSLAPISILRDWVVSIVYFFQEDRCRGGGPLCSVVLFVIESISGDFSVSSIAARIEGHEQCTNHIV